MAWTEPPRTWVTSELVTAAILNAHVRDQLIYLKAERNLAATHIAGAPFSQHGANPAARVTKSATQAIANSTQTAVTFDTEIFDTDTMHDNAVNPSRLTCKTAGIYVVSVCAVWEINNSFQRTAAIRVNGVDASAAENMHLASVDINTRISATDILQLALNDYVELWVWQNSGISLNIEIAKTSLAMARIG